MRNYVRYNGNMTISDTDKVNRMIDAIHTVKSGIRDVKTLQSSESILERRGYYGNNPISLVIRQIDNEISEAVQNV